MVELLPHANAALGCSVIFLTSYVTRMILTGPHAYPGEGWLRSFYLLLPASHGEG